MINPYPQLSTLLRGDNRILSSPTDPQEYKEPYSAAVHTRRKKIHYFGILIPRYEVVGLYYRCWQFMYVSPKWPVLIVAVVGSSHHRVHSSHYGVFSPSPFSPPNFLTTTLDPAISTPPSRLKRRSLDDTSDLTSWRSSCIVLGAFPR